MIQKQISKLQMYQRMVTIKTNALYNAIFSAIPAFTALWDAFVAGIQPIETAAQEQSIPITPAAADKEAKRILMNDEASVIHLVLVAFAVEPPNTELEMEMAFADSDIAHASEARAIELSQLIHDRALAFQPQIGVVGYDVSMQDIQSLQTRIDNFQAAINAPIIAEEEHAEITDSLKPMFLAQDTQLTKLDKKVGILFHNNKNAYNAWFNGRKQTTTGTQHSSLIGKIKNSETGLGIAHAQIEFVELNLKFKAGLKGNYHTGHLPEGYYTIKITAPGYTPLTLHTDIIQGQPLKLDINLNHV